MVEQCSLIQNLVCILILKLKSLQIPWGHSRVTTVQLHIHTSPQSMTSLSQLHPSCPLHTHHANGLVSTKNGRIPTSLVHLEATVMRHRHLYSCLSAMEPVAPLVGMWVAVGVGGCVLERPLFRRWDTDDHQNIVVQLQQLGNFFSDYPNWPVICMLDYMSIDLATALFRNAKQSRN